ncbi:MAG: hypothetical protein V1862_08085 [Methanobacteriota archaeon]
MHGPDLYLEAKALPNYVEWLKEAAPVSGVSHNVLGGMKQGEALGRTGPIVESIQKVQSVDLVTTPDGISRNTVMRGISICVEV